MSALCEGPKRHDEVLRASKCEGCGITQRVVQLRYCPLLLLAGCDCRVFRSKGEKATAQ
jgi:hypothetical protein